MRAARRSSSRRSRVLVRTRGACVLVADAGVLRRAIRMGLGAVSPDGRPSIASRSVEDVAAASRFDPAASSVHDPTSAVSPFDWTAFLATYPARPAPPFFDDVIVAEGNERSNAIAGAGASRRDGATAAAERVAAISSDAERVAAVASDVARIVREVASVEVGPADPLMDSGIDSLAGIELKNKVEAMYGVELPATAAFDYPSVEALAGYLAAKIKKEEEEKGEEKTAGKMEGTGENIGVLEGVGVLEGSPSAAVSRRSGPPRTPGVPPPGRSSVSILGWAGVAPPAACASDADPTPFASRDGISTLPWDRWDHDLAGASDPSEAPTVAAASSGLSGGWIVGASRFDPAAFGVSLAESSLMDPQQRLLLEAVASLVRCPTSAPAFAAAAGLPGARASSARSRRRRGGAVAVVDYSRVVPLVRQRPRRAFRACVRLHSAASRTRSGSEARVSRSTPRVRRLSSPIVAPPRMPAPRSDTRRVHGFGGVAETAPVAAGAALVLAPHATSIFAAAGMLAPDGRCKTLAPTRMFSFDTGYLGRIRQVDDREGRRERVSARRHVQRHVADEMVSSAVNQDGRSASLTAPNGPSQQAVLTAAARGASALLDRPGGRARSRCTARGDAGPIPSGRAPPSTVIPPRRAKRCARFEKSVVFDTRPSRTEILEIVLVGRRTARVRGERDGGRPGAGGPTGLDDLNREGTRCSAELTRPCR